MTPENDVLEGDCVEVMATFEAESVDAIVCDPPYDLTTIARTFQGKGGSVDPRTGAERSNERRQARGFMGKSWDGTGVAFRVETWTEALRVARPGAHLLAFGGTRTYHRLACAIEDAGWEIRDCLVWAYASGFPKSLNFPDGWGTALKPAWEPIVMARKPLRGTVAANRDAHGTGALNIDGTRIAGGDVTPFGTPTNSRGGLMNVTAEARDPARVAASIERANTIGRWPANVILTDPIFDGDVPGVVGGGEQESGGNPVRRGGIGYMGGSDGGATGLDPAASSGTYSRFFLIPKAARSDREPVLGGLPVREKASTWGDIGPVDGNPRKPDNGHVTTRANVHPTVKPTELMRHLVRLVTPPGGLVLDPFLGSGTTALAAEMEGFRWLGIEKEPEYVAIARARLLGTQRGLGLSA